MVHKTLIVTILARDTLSPLTFLTWFSNHWLLCWSFFRSGSQFGVYSVWWCRLRTSRLLGSWYWFLAFKVFGRTLSRASLSNGVSLFFENALTHTLLIDFRKLLPTRPNLDLVVNDMVSLPPCSDCLYSWTTLLEELLPNHQCYLIFLLGPLALLVHRWPLLEISHVALADLPTTRLLSPFLAESTTVQMVFDAVSRYSGNINITVPPRQYLRARILGRFHGDSEVYPKYPHRWLLLGPHKIV